MRSVRYRKLMQGLGALSQEHPKVYSFNVSPGVDCQCTLHTWRCSSLMKIEQCQPPTSLLEHFTTSLQLPQQILGKKSSEIIISKDFSLCLKNINEEDLNTFQKIFQDYKSFKANEKDPILVPIYAILILNSEHNENHSWVDFFALMPNLKPPNCTLFDIKGHTDNRLVPPTDFKDFSFGKDQNFRKSEHRKALKQASIEIKKQMFHKIEVNVDFLKKHRIIDYSFVLVFQEIKQNSNEQQSYGIKWISINKKYRMSYYIIDFLQVYNQRKKLQNKVKSLFFKAVSSVDPETYANRLLQFLEKNLF